MQKKTFWACDIKQRETFASNVAQMYQNIYGVAFEFLKTGGHHLVTQFPTIFLWQLHDVFHINRPAKSFYDTQFDFRAVAKCVKAKTRQKSESILLC